MYTTVNENGVINNYASEPQLYYAEYPSPEQQNRYKFQAAVATLLVTAIVLVAFGVS
ncbi:photosystem II assembly protein Psb34 [Nostoc sp.]|uniref:photosystem II assembly protein Psb34 n=1 Tax=Nostoc sp. TaxID=1180 RepID=UPI002FF57B2A